MKKVIFLFSLVALVGDIALGKEGEIKVFSGKVDVSKKVSQKISPTGVLFVYVRKLGAETGPPVAVIKIANPKYPQSFVIGPDNSMMPAKSVNPFAGKYMLFARHSETGEAMTKEGFIGKFNKKNEGVEAGESFPTILIDTDYTR